MIDIGTFHKSNFWRRIGKSERVSHSVVSNSLQPHGLELTMLLSPWISPGKNTGVGSHSFLQGIFLTQGSNPGLLHCRWILYCLSHQGSPMNAASISNKNMGYISLKLFFLSVSKKIIYIKIKVKFEIWSAFLALKGLPPFPFSHS